LTFADYTSYSKISKAMYGKTYFGNERTTFVIDPDGKVAEVLRSLDLMTRPKTMPFTGSQGYSHRP